MDDVYLRPLGLGEILDRAFSLYRHHFTAFFLTALIPTLPLTLFWSVFGLAFSRQVTAADGGVGLRLLLLPVSLVIGALVWGALVHETARAYRGEPVSWRGGLGAAAARLVPLLGGVLLSWLGIVLGMVLFVVPGVLLAIRWFAVIPAIMLEGAGPLDALRRSGTLARGAWGRIFGVMVLLILITALPSLALGVSLGIGAMVANPGSETVGGAVLVASEIVSTLVTALTTPLLMAGLVLLYYDRRVRAEGLDLEWATERLEVTP